MSGCQPGSLLLLAASGCSSGRHAVDEDSIPRPARADECRRRAMHYQPGSKRSDLCIWRALWRGLLLQLCPHRCRSSQATALLLAIRTATLL
eukprot:2108371-Rhodomonas_salina.2